MQGYSNSLAKCNGKTKAKRAIEKSKYKIDTGSCFYIDQHNIVHDIYRVRYIYCIFITISIRMKL